MVDTYASLAPEGSDLRRVLAPNPSPMTERGTNTWLVGRADLAVIDPGPALPAHLDAIGAAIDGRPVRAILVTHAHRDHSSAARPLADRTGAPVLAFGDARAGRSPSMRALAAEFAGIGGGEGVDAAFRPDRRLADGEAISGADWSLTALHTPGHMGNHLAFHWPEARLAFTGDTVMGWASTLISPPDGDVGQFLASLDRLAALDAATFLCGHGPRIAAPAARCRELADHRRAREAAIADLLATPVTIERIVAALYADVSPALHPAAARNVLAHLLHLRDLGLAAADPGPTPGASWRRP